MKTLQISGFNPIQGQLLAFDDELDLDELGDEWFLGPVRFSKLKRFNLAKSIKASFAKTHKRIDKTKYGRATTQDDRDTIFTKWILKNPDTWDRSLRGDIKANNSYWEHTKQHMAAKLIAGAHKADKTKATKVKDTKVKADTVIKEVLKKAPVSTKDAVMRIVRAEKVKKDAIKREAACPCKAREKSREVRGVKPQISANVQKGLKSILGHLKYANLQREATSEHRGMLTESQFRERVLRLLAQCSSREEQNNVLRVLAR